jgi:hypothetical protein
MAYGKGETYLLTNTQNEPYNQVRHTSLCAMLHITRSEAS